MLNSRDVSRRTFLRRAALASMAGVGAPTVVSSSVLGHGGTPPPSERLQLALIGAGSMGRENLQNCARYDDVVVTGVCDVWKSRRDATVEKYRDTAKPYNDFRELLQRDDVDAVIIATPPHWHALIAIEACEATKDIYLQKPMTLYPDEALALRNAVRKHERISQVGTQIHAGENYRRVVEYVRSGKLGKVSVVRTFNVMNQGVGGIGSPPDSDPPKGLDWNLWVGPAPMRAFNELIVEDAYHNCSFMDYSGGWTPGMAPHIIDLPYWALELGYPTVTSCAGGRFTIDDLGDTPDSQETIWQYPELTMTWTMSMVNSFGFDFGRGEIARRLGIYFHAVNGTLFSNYGKHEIVAEGDRLETNERPATSIVSSPGHEREWLDCVKTRQQPSCNIDYHAKIDVAIALANISCKLGRSVRFDAERETVVGDAEARALARPTYREPWKFPAEYLLPTVSGKPVGAAG